MHLNRLKKIMQASKLVKGHLNNLDQIRLQRHAQQLQCCCTYHTLITLGKHAITSLSKMARIFPSLIMKL